MSTITTYPLNGVDYDAADVAAYESARTSGVYSADEDFSVTAAGGLDVTVGAGRAWVHPSRFAGYSITKREPETVTLPLADGTRPRIDRILLRYDAAARKTSLLILTGDPASTPTAPAITRTELTYDLCLAEIARPAGSTEVTSGQITDTRLDESLCGVMSDGVTGLPTEQLLAEARARIAEVEETASNSAAAADRSQKAAAQNQQDAEAARDAAAGSARAASTSETNAGQSAEKAAASEGNAKASEDAAKASEEAAAKSEAAAQASKEAAAKSESASADSADKARAEADRAAQASLDAVRQAAESGAFKGDKGDPGPAGPQGEKGEKGDTIGEDAIQALIDAALAEQNERIRFWISTESTSPAELFGGTWEQITDRFIVAAGGSYGYGSTGGAKTVTLTKENMPNYTLRGDVWVGSVSDAYGSEIKQLYSGKKGSWQTSITTGGSGTAFSILPPYLAMYMWRRV